MRRVHIMGGQGRGKTTLARQSVRASERAGLRDDCVGWEGRRAGAHGRGEARAASRDRPGEKWVTEGRCLAWTDPLRGRGYFDLAGCGVARGGVENAAPARKGRVGGSEHSPWLAASLRFIWYTRHYYLNLHAGPRFRRTVRGVPPRARTAARVSALGEKGMRVRSASDWRDC